MIFVKLLKKIKALVCGVEKPKEEKKAEAVKVIAGKKDAVKKAPSPRKKP